ncbi:hypothetical protein H0H87_007707 [Tephrocybe sp. NHM501043]|nr:hypothetical protein H0H87_007707 [Tephrocybe sp. NHM501043]
MFFPTAVATALLLIVADIAPVAAAASGAHALSRLPRHHDLSERILARAPADPTAPKKKVRRRRTCIRPPPSGSSSSKPAPTKDAGGDDGDNNSTTTKKPTATQAPSNNGQGNILGVAFKPSDWPTATQAGAAPKATRTSGADPYLSELSKSFNNKDNELYTKKHTGEMTYYGQGLGACGDTYDDSTYTAAVSKLLYDSWPGATAETNRNPICGPYVKGRKTISMSGSFVTSVHGNNFVNVGGDGFLNCDPNSQCHVPLTATVKHGNKMIIVQIVDRCEGCAIDDIDLTPTAFKALADPGLGRTDVEWWFNQY